MQSVKKHDTFQRAWEGMNDSVVDQVDPFHRAAKVVPFPTPVAMQYVGDEQETPWRVVEPRGRPVVDTTFHELVLPPVQSSASALSGVAAGARVAVLPTEIQKVVVGHDTPLRKS
jgi:hypothetical protein